MKLHSKLKQLLLLTIIATAGLILFSSNTTAADYDIACDPNGCTSLGNATFNEQSVAPGDSVTRYIEIKNNHHQTLNLDMTTSKDSKTDDIFLDVVDVKVIGLGGRIRFDGSLRQFLSNPSIDLGSINASGKKQVKITITLQNVGNQYQGLKAIFDLPIKINVQGSGSGGDGASQSTSPTSPSLTSLLSELNLSPEIIPLLEEVLGEASPSSPLQSPESIFNQIRSYLRWWPWLLLLIPILWWILLLLKRRSRG